MIAPLLGMTPSDHAILTQQALKIFNISIDVLRPHDDYGMQIGMLFSVPMWEKFF